MIGVFKYVRGHCTDKWKKLFSLPMGAVQVNPSKEAFFRLSIFLSF